MSLTVRVRAWVFLGLLLGVPAALIAGPTQRSAVASVPAHVILMIGDGMGPAHIRAASLYLTGREGGLFMETLSNQATVCTTPAKRLVDDPDASAPVLVSGGVTDSAAAATAMATGHKVRNGVVSMEVPGSGGRLTTLVEHFRAAGKATGVVTTVVPTDATPACFCGHAKGRAKHEEIARSMLRDGHPNLIFGAGPNLDRKLGKVGGLLPSMARDAGYLVLTNRAELARLEDQKATHVVGIFHQAALPWESDATTAVAEGGPDPYAQIPHLSEMSLAALRFLDHSTNGFFVMIEGGSIDGASHTNNTKRMLGEMVEFDRAVRTVIDWAKGREDTLVLVTADHETGGLRVVQGRPAGQAPEVKWTTNGHSGTDVRLFAWGVGAEKVHGRIENTEIFTLLSGRAPYPPLPPDPVASESTVAPQERPRTNFFQRVFQRFFE
jgi:alkaline phosphatase